MGVRKPAPGVIRRYSTISVFAALAALLASFVSVGAQPASASTVKLCKFDQPLAVTTHRGRQFVVRDDFWGTRKFCVTNSSLRPNFTVAKTGSNTLDGRVMAFPYIFTGCAWGICTPKSGLPARAPALRRPEVTWRTSDHAGGRWNAAFDLWFAKRNIKTGQAQGAELMIWLNTRNLPPDSTRIVWVDGVRWYLAHWVATHRGGASWNYIQFRRVHPVRGVKNLRLNPFIHHAERYRLVSRRWWLLNIEAGFEIQHGGMGLYGLRVIRRPGLRAEPAAGIPCG
jgi:cellulose 1,4-beta-cellobiosidase